MTTRLDALVAKHVMGALEVFHDEKYDRWMATFNNEWFEPCRPYSTDIAEAWKVVERTNEVPGPGMGTWEKVVKNWRMYGQELLAQPAENAAKYICISALMAVGVSDEEINE